jgi:site-specific DNA recombinase
LDRLRDALRSDEMDVVVFHSLDRLARKAVYQGLVLEEIEKAKLQVEFVNYPVDDSPESRMLLGMQGLFAEYERAKIIDRTRRGKLQRAREGALVGGHPPFGYRWIKRNETSRARLEISDYQAAVIRRLYRMLVDDELSTRSIARKLTQEGVATAKGAAQWRPTAVFRMLTNPVYKGSYRYRQSGQDEILIPFPALVDDITWQAAQSQLVANSRFSGRNNRRHRYLLRGLVRCPRCGGSYTGFTKKARSGYRCNRAHWGSSSTGQKCSPGATLLNLLKERSGRR